MASYTATSATTRGSVVVTGTPVPSPSPFWIDEARDNINLILPSPTVNTDNDYAIEASWVQPSPAADYTAVCSRYFAAFSTTGVPTQANSIQLYIHTRTSADNDLRIVKASAPSTTGNINGGNYKAILGVTDGTGMGGLVTDYYDGAVTPSIGWNAIPLNAAAISDFNSNPELRIAIVDSTYDYNYTEPNSPSIQRTGISSGVTSGAYLLVETGIEQWVLSINPALTLKVNGVTGTNIKFVNRTGAIEIFRSITGGTGGIFNPACTFGTGPSIPIYTRFGMQAANGDIVYTDNGLTVPFNGSNIYWGIDPIAGSTGWGGDQWQISATGTIMDNTQSCLF